MGFPPSRKCAICSAKIRQRQRLCEACLLEYGDRVEEPWLKSLIEEATYQYNLDIRTNEREVPLSWVERGT